MDSAEAEPLHAKLYSVSEHGSVQVACVPPGVTMSPSASMVEPDGTWQIWKTVCGLHPMLDASLRVSAAAGTKQAGITSGEFCCEVPPELPLEHARKSTAATEYETSARVAARIIAQA